MSADFDSSRSAAGALLEAQGALVSYSDTQLCLIISVEVRFIV